MTRYSVNDYVRENVKNLALRAATAEVSPVLSEATSLIWESMYGVDFAMGQLRVARLPAYQGTGAP